MQRFDQFDGMNLRFLHRLFKSVVITLTNAISVANAAFADSFFAAKNNILLFSILKYGQSADRFGSNPFLSLRFAISKLSFIRCWMDANISFCITHPLSVGFVFYSTDLFSEFAFFILCLIAKAHSHHTTPHNTTTQSCHLSSCTRCLKCSLSADFQKKMALLHGLENLVYSILDHIYPG